MFELRIIHHIFRVWKFYIYTTLSVVISRAAAGATQFQFERNNIWLLLLLLLLSVQWRHAYALAYSFWIKWNWSEARYKLSVGCGWKKKKLNFLNSIEFRLVPWSFINKREQDQLLILQIKANTLKIISFNAETIKSLFVVARDLEWLKI